MRSTWRHTAIIRRTAVELLVGPERTFVWETSCFLTRWLEENKRVPFALREVRK